MGDPRVCPRQGAVEVQGGRRRQVGRNDGSCPKMTALCRHLLFLLCYSFCRGTCHLIGRVDGTCNEDKTDCTCSDKKVGPKQWSTCLVYTDSHKTFNETLLTFSFFTFLRTPPSAASTAFARATPAAPASGPQGGTATASLTSLTRESVRGQFLLILTFFFDCQNSFLLCYRAHSPVFGRGGGGGTEEGRGVRGGEGGRRGLLVLEWISQGQKIILIGVCLPQTNNKSLNRIQARSKRKYEKGFPFILAPSHVNTALHCLINNISPSSTTTHLCRRGKEDGSGKHTFSHIVP